MKGGKTGFIVLRDVPKTQLVLNGVAIALKGGFRGFRQVPAGKHALAIPDGNGKLVPAEVEVKPGAVAVYVYAHDPPRLVVADSDTAAEYEEQARAGAMDQILWPFPKDAKPK